MVFRYEVLAFYFTYLTLFSLRFFRPLSVWVEDGFSLWGNCYLFYLLIQFALFSTSVGCVDNGFSLSGTCFLFYLLNPRVYAFFDLCLSGWRMVFSYEVLAFYFTYLTLFSLRFFRPLSVWVKGGLSLWGNAIYFTYLTLYSLRCFRPLSFWVEDAFPLWGTYFLTY